MILLDTNVISELMKDDRHRAIEDWLDVQQPDRLYASSVSLAEVVFSIERLPEGRRKAWLRSMMETVFRIHFPGRILPFDEDAARAYGLIVAAARGRGQSILIADGQIASIAHIRGFTIATRDTAPFEAAGIAVIDPWRM